MDINAVKSDYNIHLKSCEFFLVMFLFLLSPV